MCPFIKRAALSRILAAGRSGPIRILTRFDLSCFFEGVSDVGALTEVIKEGGRVRGVRGLHAKLYLFGERTAVGTSANVTDAGLRLNQEFGFLSDDPEVFASCESYFDDLWRRAGEDVTQSQLSEWCEQLLIARTTHGSGRKVRLPDYGASIRSSSPLAPSTATDAYDNKAFLKFFGRGSDRTSRTRSIADIVAESGCSWACTYPSNFRPRQVEDGDVLYMARIAAPEDLLIYGYAVGWRHRGQEDVATPADISKRPWKAHWPNYVRVHSGRFVNAELGAGVSMHEMLRALGADSWRSTQENQRSGQGNVDPFASYFRKPAMQLTDMSRSWIHERLERLFRKHGELDLTERRFLT